MRKTYPLRPEGKHPDRVLDAVKHDIRKYMKRERRRDLPEGTDFWDFDCRFGATQDTAEVVQPSQLMGLLDVLAHGGGEQCYVELLARPAVWERREAGVNVEADHPAQSADGPDTDTPSSDDSPH
jgi:hypothetical protein